MVKVQYNEIYFLLITSYIQLDNLIYKGNKMDIVVCPFCHTESNRGVKVCKGCQAEVQYGITKYVLWGSIIGPAFLGFVFSMMMKGAGMVWMICIPAILGLTLAVYKTRKSVTFFRTMRHS